MRTGFVIASILALTIFMGEDADAMSWSAQPLTVHEWGVQVFDWSGGEPIRPALPGFIHTDANSGVAVASKLPRVKDMPPDSGIRHKPVLYFYPPSEELGASVVGVEMRFAYGHANAWFPQVNTFRTPEVTANAKEPDWDAWRKAQGGFARRFDQSKIVPVPDDPRMELVWSRLTLSKDVPADAKLQDDLPAQHWIRTARKVQSSYVTNGAETERFLFYEGSTHEKPAIAVIPPMDLMGFDDERFAMHVVNIADTPIYNVFAIYQHDHHTWIGYSRVMESFNISTDNAGSGGSSISAISIPDFKDFSGWVDANQVLAMTTDRLISGLTDGQTLSINHDMRDPADPQGPCHSSQLFPDEAAALESIWHDDFFNSEGLTILYQESPAALDRAMPLSIYTDMYHYVKLSRCGLVLNKNVNAANVASVYYAVRSLHYAKAKDKELTVNLIKANRFLAEGALAFYLRTGWAAKDLQDARDALDGK